MIVYGVQDIALGRTTLFLICYKHTKIIIVAPMVLLHEPVYMSQVSGLVEITLD